MFASGGIFTYSPDRVYFNSYVFFPLIRGCASAHSVWNEILDITLKSLVFAKIWAGLCQYWENCVGGIFTHKGQIFRDLSDMKSEKNLIFCGEKKEQKLQWQPEVFDTQTRPFYLPWCCSHRPSAIAYCGEVFSMRAFFIQWTHLFVDFKVVFLYTVTLLLLTVRIGFLWKLLSQPLVTF